MKNYPGKRIYIMDPSLRDARGHHYQLTMLITEGAKLLGYKVKWLVNHKYNSKQYSDGVELINCFSTTRYESYNENNLKYKIIVFFNELFSPFVKYLKEKDYFNFNKRLASFKKYLENKSWKTPDNLNASIDELLNIINQHNINRDDIIIIHTADAAIYRLVLSLHLNPEIQDRLPFFHVCTPYSMDNMPMNDKGLSVERVIKYLELLGYINKNIFLYAENQLLARQLGKQWSINVSTLNIPANQYQFEENEINEKLKVLYIGPAREEKGFLLLPDIVKRIYDDGQDKNIAFDIHCAEQITGHTRKVKIAINKLRKFPDHFINLVEKNLSSDDYYDLLNKSNVILLCYDKDLYKTRGSGITIEAILASRITITTRNTFPAFITEGSGIIVNSMNDIIQGIYEINENYEKFRKQARALSDTYKKSNTPSAYVNTIVTNSKTGNFKPIDPYNDLNESQSDYRKTQGPRLVKIMDACSI